MHDEPRDHDDEQLRVLISRAVEWPRDDGFSHGVMTRIGRRVRFRAAVLSIAIATGGAIALAPAYRLVASLGTDLTHAAAQWNDGAWLAQHPLLAVGLACALLSPFVVRMLED